MISLELLICVPPSSGDVLPMGSREEFGRGGWDNSDVRLHRQWNVSTAPILLI